MTLLSSQFAGPAIALLLLSAAPVWFHGLTAPTHDPCRDPAAFFGAAKIGEAERVPWESPPGSIEGVQGKLVSGRRQVLNVRVLRTTEPSSLYWSPIDLGFHRLLYLQPMEIRSLQAGDDVLPVRWRSDASKGYSRVEAYLYSQSGMAVRHPVVSGLALGSSQLTGGTHPLYVFIVSGAAKRDELQDLEATAERWLVDTWQQLEAACSGR